MSNTAKIREEAKKLNPIDDLMFRKMAEEGQQAMCEIMEKLTREDRMRINQLNAILIKTKRYDDLERTTYDTDYQEQLMDELLPREIQNI